MPLILRFKPQTKDFFQDEDTQEIAHDTNLKKKTTLGACLGESDHRDEMIAEKSHDKVLREQYDGVKDPAPDEQNWNVRHDHPGDQKPRNTLPYLFESKMVQITIFT